MATSGFLCLGFCLLLLFHGSLAARQYQQQGGQQQQHGIGECRIQSLNPIEPSFRINNEAGLSEFWVQNSDQMQCANVVATRHIVEPRGLILPAYNNAPALVYVAQGRGMLGIILPGCAETYQSIQQSIEGRQEGQRIRDQHQKIREFRQGDIIALEVGIAHWCYNNGNDHLILIAVHDTGNADNQLDSNLRKFFIAGNPQEQIEYTRTREEQIGKNILQGFETDILAEAFGIDINIAKKLQNETDRRGNIVRIEQGLQIEIPRRSEEERRREQMHINGLEETICTRRITENIEDPERADIYSSRAGRISTLNSRNLPISGETRCEICINR